jgi:hypothetical protein
LADGALAQVPGDRFFAVLSADENSIAVLVKHVSGNMRSRWTDVLTTDGEKPWRDRDAEFEIGPGDSRDALEAAWERGWLALFEALTPLRGTDLGRTVVIRGEQLTVLQAIHRQLTHYAYHVGQIVLLARHLAGDAWKTLSIARGQSGRFNASPKSYL